jgi:hypothetical protein
MNRALFILISIILAGMLISCTTDTTEPEIGDDSELIQLIKNAPNKQIIDVTELPSASRNVLETVYGEDIVDDSKIAPELGYEIDMMRGSRARLGEEMQAYFDLTGRELRDGDGRGSGGEEECFEYVLPVTFVMPDGSTITIENEEDWIEIREWYLANPNVREEPVLQYPADIIFRDGITWTLNSDEDLRRAYAFCDDGSGGGEQCFEYVLPVTFVMPDGSTITIKDEEDWIEIRNWYEANPNVREEPVLQYPAEIIFRDRTTMTLNSDEDLREAYAYCAGR